LNSEIIQQRLSVQRILLLIMDHRESTDSKGGPSDVERVDEEGLTQAERNDNSKQLRVNANLATEDEHNTTFLDAVKHQSQVLVPGLLWSVSASPWTATI
jgi:hypothetical protein